MLDGACVFSGKVPSVSPLVDLSSWRLCLAREQGEVEHLVRGFLMVVGQGMSGRDEVWMKLWGVEDSESWYYSDEYDVYCDWDI